MKFRTISWLVVLMCLCDEGYFKTANTDFKQLCKYLIRPTLYPDNFIDEWDRYLNFKAAPLHGSLDLNERVARCKESKVDDDFVCAIIDFGFIGNRFGADTLRIQETFSSKSHSYQYYHNLYIEPWFLHPRITRLQCRNPLKTLWDYSERLSNLTSFDELFDVKSLHDNINAKGLRQEIDRHCRILSTEKICMMMIWTKIVDKIEKLLTYARRDQWENSASKMLKNAMKLYLHAVQLHIIARVQRKRPAFLFVEESKVNNLIKEITLYLSDSLQNNDIESLRSVLELLPYEIHLSCDDTAVFLSTKRTICTFINISKSLLWYLARTNTKGNIKQISTSIDYETFLHQRRLEQILNIGETTQNNLQLVAQHLKLAMKNNFGELRNYFQTLAEFDRRKALIDIDTITSTLDQYKKASEQSSKNLDILMNEIIKAALAAAIGDQIDAVLTLSLTIAEACNPLRVLFSDGIVTDILDGTQEVSQAMAGVAKAVKLKDAFDSLIKEIRAFVDKLSKNEIYLNFVSRLIKSLKTSSVSSSPSSSELKDQINTFFEHYKNYVPAVTRDDLRAITAYWENLIDEACDILDSTYGIVSGITKTILAAQRTCPNAKVEVQKLITIYEEIYDFQFGLMDSLSDCVRAFTSFQAANTINSDFEAAKVTNADNPDIFAKLELQSVFSMICYKISILSAIDSYCNILAYTQGVVPHDCIGAKRSITSILSRTKLTCSTSLEFLSIPTKPSKPGDKAYINLDDLYAGNTVTFKIPDSQWLIEHNWIASFQQDYKIFVQRFEIYLPVVSMTRKQVHVEVEATVGNQLTPPDGTEYVISPRVTLVFTYREGKRGRKCRQKEIPNPYNDNCRDVPNICPITTDFPTCSSPGNICPSIYAQWNIKLYGYENANLTAPSTNIPLSVALQVCKIPSSRQMKKYNSGFSKLLYAVEQPRIRKAYNSAALRENDMCCESNQYYDESISKCKACPSGTVDKYRGLFCANAIRFVPAPTRDIPFSLAHAQKACTKAGTTTASTKTIGEAVAHGYNECQCGWLSDGTMASPKPNESCKENGGLSTVTCTSNNTWGIYCNNIF